MTETKEKISFKESARYIFYKNPVLVLGLVIGQLAAGATSLQNGVALSIFYLFIVVPVLFFAATLGKRLPQWSRVVCYALISGLMLVPAALICQSFSPTIFDSVGIYPALLAVSTVPIVYASKFAEKLHPLVAGANGLCMVAGFAATAVILGAVREFFGSGSLWGVKLVQASFPALNFPFWGFILLGFMAALINWAKGFTKEKQEAFEGEEEAK